MAHSLMKGNSSDSLNIRMARSRMPWVIFESGTEAERTGANSDIKENMNRKEGRGQPITSHGESSSPVAKPAHEIPVHVQCQRPARACSL